MSEELNLSNSENDPNEVVKRPVFLNILLILSALYIASGFFGTTQALINGPLSEEQLEEQVSELYSSVNTLVESGIDDEFASSVEIMVDNSIYLNNEAFYSSNILTLISFIIGAMAIFMMYKLNKMGFHLYVIYSLMPIITMYALVPMHLILPMSVVLLVILGALFSILYGIHLKYMK